MDRSILLSPKMLALVTTNRCTAACRNCCFRCSPLNKDKISFEEAQSIIDECVNSFPQLCLLVLTGGECFTLGKELDKIISYASNKGLNVRVVSNGYWATSFKRAYMRLGHLKEIGLTEINVSCGDEHQEFVDFGNVINIIVACILLKITLAVNLETSSLKHITLDTIYNDIRLVKYGNLKEKGVLVSNGKWMYFRKQEKKILEQLAIENVRTAEDLRCTNVLTDINMFYNRDMYACCGLTNTYNELLRIGKGSEGNIKSTYESQFNDFYKIWLFTEGPGSIYNFIMKKRNLPLIDAAQWHLCQICQEIIMDEENIKTLKKYYHEKFSSVMIKFKMLREKHLGYPKDELNYQTN